MRADREQRSSHSSKVLACACLAGVPCRYDGGSRPDPEIAALAAAGEVLLACPECLGGLEIPREPGEVVGGTGADVLDGRARVVTRDGRDVTDAYITGAKAFAGIAAQEQVGEVVLKAKSPSCGLTQIYDGTHTGTLREGMGVTAALLTRRGIRVREK